MNFKLIVPMILASCLLGNVAKADSNQISSVFVYDAAQPGFKINVKNNSTKSQYCTSIVVHLHKKLDGQCVKSQNSTNLHSIALKPGESKTFDSVGTEAIRRAQENGLEICGILSFDYNCGVK